MEKSTARDFSNVGNVSMFRKLDEELVAQMDNTEYLFHLEDDLAAVREQGLEVIERFVYKQFKAVRKELPHWNVVKKAFVSIGATHLECAEYLQNALIHYL